MTHRQLDLFNDSYEEAVKVACIKGKDTAHLEEQGNAWMVILQKGYRFKHHWTERA